MAIITTSQNLTAVTYVRGETLEVRNGATLTISATPAIRPGNIQCITAGKVRITNSSATVPLILDLEEMNHDFRFEAEGVLEIRGAPMSLTAGTGAAQTYNFTTLFGGVIRHMTYVEVEEVAGSGVFMPWPVVHEDPKFLLDVGLNTVNGGAAPTAFSAGNTLAGRALFWHETNRTLRCGDGTNGAVIPSGCAVRIPNIYISNRMLTNSTRVFNISTTGAPTGGTFTLEFRNEAGTVLGTTVPIAFNATAATIDTAIETVTGANTVTAGGGALPAAVSITWAGSILTANSGFGDFPSVRIASNTLTGGTNPQVQLNENNTTNMSLLDFEPLGTLDAEWVSFSDKFRWALANSNNVTLKNVGTGGENISISSSLKNLTINGLANSRSPFCVQQNSSIAQAVSGDVSIERVVTFGKANVTSTIGPVPRLKKVDRVYAICFGKRTNTSTRSVVLASLPSGAKVTNLAGIGAAINFINSNKTTIVGVFYADGTLSGPQETTQALSAFVFNNCTDTVVANVGAAGPQVCRSNAASIDSASSGVQFYGGGYNCADQTDRPVFLGGASPRFQNMQFSNIRGGPMVDISIAPTTNAIVRKVFGSFASAQISAGCDPATGGQYDLVTSTIAGITESQGGIVDYVGGNFTEPSLTPTIGHVTFGPFYSGSGMAVNGSSYTNANGAVFLPTAGDFIEVTMPFAMHGITSFRNVLPVPFADIPGAAANVALIQAPGAPTGGTFTVSVFDSANVLLGTTAPQAFNVSVSDLDNAITAIPGIGNEVVVFGSLSGGLTVVFPTGQRRIVTVNGSALTGGTEPGVAYAVGRVRLQDGTETLGSVNTHEFAVRVPNTAWPAYQALTGSNLAGAIGALSGYAAGGSGLEMRIRISTGQTNPLTNYNQISLPTNVNPALWTADDASIVLNGPEATDVTKVFRASDNSLLYSFTGSGTKSFTVGANFDAAVYFRRENASGTVLMTTLPATQLIGFGANGTVNLFYGAQVQLAQASTLSTLDSLIQSRLDVAVSTRLAATSYTAAPTLAQIEASAVLAKEATVSTRATQASLDTLATTNQAEHDATQAAIAGLPEAPSAAAVAGAVWAEPLETGFSASRVVRTTAAAAAGKASGGPGAPAFRNLADTQDQITGTADASGNRTDVTYGA